MAGHEWPFESGRSGTGGWAQKDESGRTGRRGWAREDELGRKRASWKSLCDRLVSVVQNGPTTHMRGDKSCLNDLKSCKIHIVTFADGTKGKVISKGTLESIELPQLEPLHLHYRFKLVR